MTTKFLSHRQVASLIKAVGHKRTVIVRGEMGGGKTSIAHEFQDDPFFSQHHVLTPIDCSQLSDGSVWMPDIDREAGVSRELPNERFGVHKHNRLGVNGAKPVVICFDEIAKTRQYIKDTLAPIIFERRIGDNFLPDNSVVFACTNLDDEGLGDNMQAHLRNRVCVVNMRKPTQKEWVLDFAIPRRLAPEIIAATEMFPLVFDSFTDYRPGGKFDGKTMRKDNPYIVDPTDAQQDQVVTPRSLHAASDIVKASDKMDDDTLQCALDGVVGEAFGAQLTSFIRFGRDIPAFDRVVADPAGTPLSSNPTAQIVQVFQFITQTRDREQVASVVEYVLRMKNEMQSLFINSVSNSASIAMFCTDKRFSALLQDNRQFFN